MYMLLSKCNQLTEKGFKMYLPVYMRYVSDVKKTPVMGTIMTSVIHPTPFFGIGMKSSGDREVTVRCEFFPYHCRNDNFGYKIKAVPYTEELQHKYGVGETYYTSDFENLMGDDMDYSIDGYTTDIIDRLRSVKRSFKDVTDNTHNPYEEGSLEHFYMNELIEEKVKDDLYNEKLEQYYKDHPEDREASAFM